jgi:TRAP-type C4-dicarboxylate transport system permease small subunit
MQMDWLVDRLVMLMAVVSGFVLTGLVALTFYDVILRYFFSAPLRGRQDIVEMGMVLTMMLAAPYTWRIGGHISIDLYEEIPFYALEILRRLLMKLVVAGVFGLIAWRAIEAAEDAQLFGEATNMVLIPHLPFIRSIMAVMALHALILLFETVLDIRQKPDDAAPPGAAT